MMSIVVQVRLSLDFAWLQQIAGMTTWVRASAKGRRAAQGQEGGAEDTGYGSPTEQSGREGEDTDKSA